ncbi:hypothetical protein [Terrisporobacter mayombei]|uniref:Uncharacterized protein n=1 Tax=Terrisporobacter mayombei TaxID=1541 RepID=A0ABY9Q0U2_9FIRM|nr:hypothetical protein [Terrisporobacter mayombei]MCC3866862.1 hypothetical protein [Terrisporobacter mayombei]WMT81103.1 hypothetical protein TEMA_14350 [Terrisporobacter mayombei]
MELFTPRCKKRSLLLIAGLVWIFAGGMVSKLGFNVLFTSSIHPFTSSIHPFTSIMVAVVTFLIFFNFIFIKLVKKHKVRISEKEQDKLCLFSFFDVKSYVIMIFMMGLGITIRSINSINPLCWAAIYIGIGLALLSAGVAFMVEWKNWN